ncbi:MAG: ABC transporter [Peptococcaceae bacterium BRH_c4a]|nr:MAG: ABC transporter [Peptococcaceae bacterium BRH_c4a]
MTNNGRKIKIQVQNLTKRFGDLLVLNNISFNVYEGEFLCIVGPTGCGKTTFLNVLTKLHPATEGDIYIDGEPANPQKHNISFVFQEPSTMPWLTVEQNIRYGLEVKKVPEEEIKKRLNQVMELVGLKDFRNYYPRQLSASMDQRVVIARAFAINPDLLLMDEPYSQLDIKLRYYLEDEVIRIWREMKRTVIFVTHNIEEAVYLAERILILTPKPATIKKEIKVDLPRPRNFADPEFVNIRNQVTEMIKWW